MHAQGSLWAKGHSAQSRKQIVFLEKLNLPLARLHAQIYSELFLESHGDAWTPSPQQQWAASCPQSQAALPSDGLLGVRVAS